MTALDQAFIKAFSPKGAAADKTPAPALRPAVPLSQALASPHAPATPPPAPATSPISTKEPGPTVPISSVVSLLEPRGVPASPLTAEAAERNASIERLFANLAKSASRPMQSTPARPRTVAANEPATASGTVYRADPGSSATPAPLSAAPILAQMIDEPPCAAAVPATQQMVRMSGSEEPGSTAWTADPEMAQPGPGFSGTDDHSVATAATPEPEPYLPQPMETSIVPPPHLNLWQAEAGQPSGRIAAEPPASLGATDRPWQPMLQVEHFLWPKICFQLHMVAVRSLDHVADAMTAAVSQGQKVLAVGGCRAGDGATTMLLCTARQLARRGLRAIMVEGTFADPQLATRLGLLPQDGWEDVLAGRLPLEEVVIASIEDRLALLPVVKPQSGMAGLIEGNTAMAASLNVLAMHYDVVLVDVGPLEDRVAGGSPMPAGNSRLDAAVMVANPRCTASDRLSEIQRGLSAAGVAQLGVIHNFTRCQGPIRE